MKNASHLFKDLSTENVTIALILSRETVIEGQKIFKMPLHPMKEHSNWQNKKKDSIQGAQVLNNKALIFLKQKLISKAVSAFQAAALFQPQNALYHCNYGYSLMLLGDQDKAFDSYIQAQICYKESKQFQELSNKNKEYLLAQLARIKRNLEFQRHKETKYELQARKRLALALNPGRYRDISDAISSIQMETNSYNTLQAKLEFFFLQGKEPLRNMYQGMEKSFTQAYRRAQLMAEALVKPQTSIKWLILEKGAQAIPYVGTFLSKAISYASEAILKDEMRRKARNLIALSSCCSNRRVDPKQRYLTIMQDLTINIIFNYKDVILRFSPKETLNQCNVFIQGIGSLRFGKEEFEKTLIEDEMFKIHPIEQYGQMLIMKLVQQCIFTGKVYRNLAPRLSTREEVLSFLMESAKSILFFDEEFLDTLIHLRDVI